MVVVMRNAESSGNRDGNNMFAWDSSGKCIGESTLTPEGKTQAQKLVKHSLDEGSNPWLLPLLCVDAGNCANSIWKVCH